VEVGIRHNPDYNGASQEGIAMSQVTIAAGRRMSTARCYLDPIRERRNLHIETEALTEGLLLDGRRCTGVRYSVAGDVRASREVVVSAGTINSPQLLELSGIGQPEQLGSLGIEVHLTTARIPARPAEIFNGRNRRGSLRKINPCGYRHDRAALGNLRNMTTARQRRLWPPAPCSARPLPSPAVDARPRRRVSPPRSCFLLTWPSPQPTAVSWRVFRTSPDGYTRSST
jgi:hypothetical protein